MSTSSESTTIAFLGATGGCANACLTHTLKAGYKATALARTPSKLTSLLQTQGLDDETLNKNLTIVQGDATDVSAVKRAVAPERNNGALVSTIVSGLGGSPKMQSSLFRPVTLDNPHICEKGINALVTAVREVQQSQPEQQDQKSPLLAVISTTGISAVKEDVPFGMRMLYHYLLAVPHEDKRKMEKAVMDTTTTPFRGVVSVRPTLLTGDQNISSGNGWEELRAGTETDPAIGYSVSRVDVGQWIFEEVVRTGGGKWVNQKVTLTN